MSRDPDYSVIDRVVSAMPWYDEANPNYTELEEVISDIRDEAVNEYRKRLAEDLRGTAASLQFRNRGDDRIEAQCFDDIAGRVDP